MNDSERDEMLHRIDRVVAVIEERQRHHDKALGEIHEELDTITTRVFVGNGRPSLESRLVTLEQQKSPSKFPQAIRLTPKTTVAVITALATAIAAALAAGGDHPPPAHQKPPTPQQLQAPSQAP